MDSNDKPCPIRREIRPGFRRIGIGRIRRGIATCRLVACDTNACEMKAGGTAALGMDFVSEISFEELNERLRKSQEQLQIRLSTELLKRRLESQEKSRRDCRDEFEKLSTCISTLRGQLEKFWSSTAEFSRRRTQCQGRRFSLRSYYLKRYLELVLDFKLSSYYLGPDGKLDRALQGAQGFLSTSELWSSNEFVFAQSTSPSQTAEDLLLANFRNAQLRLNELSAYGALLETNFENVKEQLEQLLSVEDALDEEQRQTELEQRQSERSMERLERFMRDVTLRLQMLVVLLLLCGKFSGVSDNDQPMCTTMPWNIRPALIVLWGVCWMFYTPEGNVDPTGRQDTGLDRNLDISMIDWPQWINDGPFQISNQDPSLYNQDPIAQRPTLPAATEASTPFFMPDFFQDLALDAASLNQSLYKGGPDRRVALDPKDAFSSLNLTSNMEVLPTYPMISGYHPGLANEQLAGFHPGLVPSASTATDRPNTLAEQSTSSSRPLSGSEQPRQPTPYRPEVSMTCEHTQCSGLTFDHPSDWNNCKYSLTPHFKRKDNFVDHLKRLHGYSPANAKAKADSETISQARSQLELQTEPHSPSCEIPNIPTIATSAANAGPAMANSSQPDRTLSTAPGPSKKRRLSKTAPYPSELSDLSRNPNQEPYNEEETWKRKVARYETEMEALRAQNASLRTRNDLLESRIQRLEANQDSLIAMLAERRSS
ncbi:hypothetical protein SNOG_03339 [Parastagonospora nodorum SN15]|uniref:Uncharacterized protein n=1 Tax=Phaeosphaeria nodorum (strain SN15 / ATCC MYA-4574 / FGSC 10173) TaxID=321614 RepID=Q0UY25_PHANO|nr:hypothetical protein SNOG_03339 [Parastagonospora nodorum SN15]EAT88544.1 hypothetical protein SNOG_03339 [Parastagonospora nodorum SN15]